MAIPDPINTEQCILFLKGSSIYKYWDKETQDKIIELVQETPVEDLPKMMEDFQEQENKIKLSEDKEALEKKKQLSLEMRAKAIVSEKKDQEEAQAYAEKLLESLGKTGAPPAATKKKKLFGMF